MNAHVAVLFIVEDRSSRDKGQTFAQTLQLATHNGPSNRGYPTSYMADFEQSVS